MAHSCVVDCKSNASTAVQAVRAQVRGFYFFIDLFYLGIARTEASVSWTATIAKSYSALIIAPGTGAVHG
jgi:hypothetical protein